MSPPVRQLPWALCHRHVRPRTWQGPRIGSRHRTWDCERCIRGAYDATASDVAAWALRSAAHRSREDFRKHGTRWDEETIAVKKRQSLLCNRPEYVPAGSKGRAVGRLRPRSGSGILPPTVRSHSRYHHLPRTRPSARGRAQSSYGWWQALEVWRRNRASVVDLLLVAA